MEHSFLHCRLLLLYAGSFFNRLATLGNVYFSSYIKEKSRRFVNKFKFG